MLIGIDIGSVIIDRIDEKNDTSFLSENYLITPQVKDCFSSIKRMIGRYGKQSIYLVSKCRAETKEKTVNWLDSNRFWDKTGVDKNHLFIVPERRMKAEICARLRLAYFIDDRLEVLSYLKTVLHKILFNARDWEIEKFKEFLPQIEKRVQSWAEILEYFSL